ncbi:putative Membrane protein [Bradyrhizobium sp. ORS 375]|uniref:hopanoid transporter HpnN n=1 Tax=Bradyrhizobium sp. (strain ORS 375) TaxID=566679 RepID=UPI0002409087|nr:MMPL family transporter [Bradyrhizobium sp. ORS 375]CCD91570.1 putative Membrane protein [Bradyrhizobium sp. ORS 375]
MITRLIVRIVDSCAQHKWATLVLGMLLMIGCSLFAVTRFQINTDVEALIAQDLPWHRRQAELERAFPQRAVTVVVEGRTAEGATLAADRLADSLRNDRAHIRQLNRPDAGLTLEGNGLLYSSEADLKQLIAGLTTAKPLLRGLASDPSLRGVVNMLTSVVQSGQVGLDRLARPLAQASETLKDVLAGRPATFSWQALLQGHDLPLSLRRHFIEVSPVLNFDQLQPGRAATQAIRGAAHELALKRDYDATVAPTGQVPMNDEQFSVIRESALRDTLAAVFGVIVVLWLALRSWKLIVAVLFSLAVGLAATAALGLLMVGSFNLISIAFFVLFVGLGVDFGIQLSVRYRAERHEIGDLRKALRNAAHKAGDPLALAAAATAVAFFAFLPTSYRGLSELGLIAGFGMILAFVSSITMVPAALMLLAPAGEAAPIGFPRLAPLDNFLQRHRKIVLAVTAAVILAGLPLLFQLRFDFNPINLQNPSSPAVATYRKLQQDPLAASLDAELLAANLEDADQQAKRLSALPEVARTSTLSTFIPAQQDGKLAILHQARSDLGPALRIREETEAPTDEQTVAALQSAAKALQEAARADEGEGGTAARDLAGLLEQLANADAAARERAALAFIQPLTYDLQALRSGLSASRVTRDTLPPDLKRDWVLPDGRARVQISPRGNANDADVLRGFARAVLAAAPVASGAAISYYESSRTVTGAFVEAGLLALLAITALLYIALRRIGDVLLTLIPLLVAGLLALEIMVIWGLPLNFANIVALPLLLGVGVAFKIYYIMAWRAGKTHLLQSALTQAVVFSALTNAVAFGSMWASEYPGMSSMGRLMALSLLCTMTAAVLFQPVLMGQPRDVKPFARECPEAPPAAE